MALLLGCPIVIATLCTPDKIALFDRHGGVSRKRGFFETTLSAFIAEFGLLTARRVRDITSPSWRPGSAGNGGGAKWPLIQWFGCSSERKEGNMSNKQDLEQNVVSDKPISDEPKDNNKNTSSIDFGHQGESDKTVKRNFVKRLINKVIEYKKLTTFESLSLLITLCGLISIILLMLQLMFRTPLASNKYLFPDSVFALSTPQYRYGCAS